jgi:hypothetical protein
VAPILGETIASYLTRLAAANHLPIGLVLAHLPRWFTARICTHDDLAGATRAGTADAEHLAALSGLTTATLLRALPAFGCDPHRGRPFVRATPTPADGARPGRDIPHRSRFTCQRTSGYALGTWSGSAAPPRSTSRPPRSSSTPTAGPPGSPTATAHRCSCSPK